MGAYGFTSDMQTIVLRWLKETAFKTSASQVLPRIGAEASILAIGMMSGTSLDGIDASIVYTDGEEIIDPVIHPTAHAEQP